MFGGQEKILKGKHRLRGDINVLLLGDLGYQSQEIATKSCTVALRCQMTEKQNISVLLYNLLLFIGCFLILACLTRFPLR